MIDLYDKPLADIGYNAFINIRDELKDDFIIDCATALSLKKVSKIEVLEHFTKTKIGDKLHLALIKYYLACKDSEYNAKIHQKYNLPKGDLSRSELSYITRIPIDKVKYISEYYFLKSQNRDVLLCQLGIVAHSISYTGYWNVFSGTKVKDNSFLPIRLEFNP